MSKFPPRTRLDAVLAALALDLPESHRLLLAAEELVAGRTAIEGLADPAVRAKTVDALEPAEAAWMADRLLAAWARIGDSRMEPAAAILGPDMAWVPGPQAGFEVVVLGLVPGWKVDWSGPLRADGATAELFADPPNGPASVTLDAAVVGRRDAGDGTPGERDVLRVRVDVELRRPQAVLDAAGRLRIVDQTGAPADELKVVVAGREVIVAEDGSVDISVPMPAGTVVEVGEARLAVKEMTE